MDHDQQYKKLLTTFFYEFLALFLPDVLGYLDPDTRIEFLDKEVFTDVTAGEKRLADVVAKVRFRSHDAFFLIHVENQASKKKGFPKRMFRYFARLHEKYDLPVYPVAVFSYDAPKRPEPNRYEVAFPDKTVLQFNYETVQLNRLSWRQVTEPPNPVAAALMAQMNIAPAERVEVYGECWRLLTMLQLDPARSELVGSFIESYLKLTTEEEEQYRRELEKLPPEEQETRMEMMTRWRREGIQEGKEKLVTRLINKRLGSVPSEITTRLDRLSSDQLDELGEALLDFTSVADLEDWLARCNPQ